MITSSRAPLAETDYNLHKSNSTYFSDLDVGRLHLLACIMRTGLHKAYRRGGGAAGGRLAVVLGGVTCGFRREIRPYVGYEVWTRVLAWDGKWLYLVSHVVRKGAVEPRGYSVQTWRNRGSGGSAQRDKEGVDAQSAIYATSIAKYVFKSGRLTVPPERVLVDCELLPPKPEGWGSPPVSVTPAVESGSVEISAAAVVQGVASLPEEEILDTPDNVPVQEESWTWERIEEERARGMKIAVHMAELDALQGEFTAGSRPALGRW